MLETQGEVKFDKDTYEECLNKPLACHKCGRELNQIPKLKDHIRKCKGPGKDLLTL